jgi:transcriptional regulator with XRE-family HTH domain
MNMIAIKIERVKRGLRQCDVAAMTEGIVPQHRLSLLERGVRPRPEEVKALADAFKMNPEELFQMA